MTVIGHYEALPKPLRDQMENRFMWAISTGPNHPDATVEKAVETIIQPLLHHYQGAVAEYEAAQPSREALVQRIAAELDRPSLYMGGPSLSSRRKAERIVDLTDDHYQGARNTAGARLTAIRSYLPMMDSANDAESVRAILDADAAAL